MSLVTYELEEHVATITLNRPEARNAINGPLRQEINAAWDRFRDEEEAWVGILTATGDVFCAGGDLKDGEGSVGTFGGTFWEKPTINSFESGMELFFKPTIAAVHGPCVGYGVTGVLFCDFVIASTEATFSFPEVRLGVPTIVGAIRLPHRVGWANAMELLLTGKPISAERAKEIAGVEARRTRGPAGGGAGMGQDTDRGRAVGTAGDQGGGVANRRHGLDRVGALRRGDAQGRRCHRGRRRRPAGLAGETHATVEGTLTGLTRRLGRR